MITIVKSRDNGRRESEPEIGLFEEPINPNQIS